MKKWGKKELDTLGKEQSIRKLTRKKYLIKEAQMGDETSISQGVLTIRNDITEAIVNREPRIKEMTVNIVKPKEHDFC
jgi:Glycine/sarcosine/betaine reductase component B subunits.